MTFSLLQHLTLTPLSTLPTAVLFSYEAMLHPSAVPAPVRHPDGQTDPDLSSLYAGWYRSVQTEIFERGYMIDAEVARLKLCIEQMFAAVAERRTPALLLERGVPYEAFQYLKNGPAARCFAWISEYMFTRNPGRSLVDLLDDQRPYLDQLVALRSIEITVWVFPQLRDVLRLPPLPFPRAHEDAASADKIIWGLKLVNDLAHSAGTINDATAKLLETMQSNAEAARRREILDTIATLFPDVTDMSQRTR